MNIIVLHGDDVRQSYSRLKVLLNHSKIQAMRVEKIFPDLSRSLSERLIAKNIFNEKVIYVVENINQFPTNDLKWLKDNLEKLEGELIIYVETPLGKTILNLLPKKAKVEEFKLPNFLWKFLDSFYPGNSKICLNLLHKVAQTDNIERVFALLARHLKNLYIVRLDKNSLGFPSWRLSKLISQASKFKGGKIENLISEMARIDIEAKISKVTLSDALDFLISTQLE